MILLPAAARLGAVPTLPGQDLPATLRHDLDGPALGPLEELVEPFRAAGALLVERGRRRGFRPVR